MSRRSSFDSVAAKMLGSLEAVSAESTGSGPENFVAPSGDQTKSVGAAGEPASKKT